MNSNDPRHLRLLEAILFASADPLSERALAHHLPEGAGLQELLKELHEAYQYRGVNLVRAGKSWAFRTAPDLSQQLNMEVDVPRKPSRAAIETLAIIAYHQPVTRAEIEEVRGVGLSRGTLDMLLEAGWIKPKGRRRTPGRPMTWGTTDDFLDHFGLEDVRDLPGMDELKAAGLLDSGPAISAYQSSGPASQDEGGGDDQDEKAPGLLELIETTEAADNPTNDDPGDDPTEDEPGDALDDVKDDTPEPLDPGDGEGNHA